MNGTRAILIEGLDLAGKSTLTRALVVRLQRGFALRRNSLVKKNEVYDFADELRRSCGVDASVLGPLYLAALELDLQRVGGELDGGEPVVQDSLIGLRSYVYYVTRGDMRLAQEFARLLSDPRHPTFDKAVVLTASIDARRERLDQRRRLAPEEVAEDDLAVEKDPTTFKLMEKMIVRKAMEVFRSIEVDTTGLHAHEVEEKVRQIMEQP